jgi:hypothetical protein
VPRLVADDATPEAVGRLLAEQRGRLGVFSSEGGPLAILAGRYSDGRTNCELFLKAHSGDAYHLDRIGRPSIRLTAPLLTIALTVQPSVIAGLASTPELRALGLLARFLYAIPRTMPGSRDPDAPPVVQATRVEYARRVRELLDWEPELDEHGELTARAIPLSEGARHALVAFKAELEPRLGPTGDLHALADWANKLPGTVARIAGLLHVGDRGTEGLSRMVDQPTVERAVHIGRYAIAHARTAFGLMGADTTMALAKAVWAFALRGGQRAVTRHELHRGLQGRVRRVTELDPALEILVERGLLRAVQLTSFGRRGRPPGPIYEITPERGSIGAMSAPFDHFVI